MEKRSGGPGGRCVGLPSRETAEKSWQPSPAVLSGHTLPRPFSSRWQCNRGTKAGPLLPDMALLWAALALGLPIGLADTFSELHCVLRPFTPQPSSFPLLSQGSDLNLRFPTCSCSFPVYPSCFPWYVPFLSNSALAPGAQKTQTDKDDGIYTERLILATYPWTFYI